jgi:large subunit ribosomal protein L3
MLTSVLGKKIGMTQVFDAEGNVTPVTVIDTGNLYVTQLKSLDKDGYAALQLGLLRDKYCGQEFSQDWLKSKKKFFTNLKEVRLEDGAGSFELGQAISIDKIAFLEGQKVAVTGKSKGLGFQGVVKRWGFSGGPKTHGSKFHRRPGAISHMRTQGEVIKGKKFPGHMGCQQFTIRGLEIVKIEKEKGFLLVKGSVPGKKDSLVLIRKQGK